MKIFEKEKISVSNDYNGPYKDIIDMPHHVSKKHKPMSRHDRAAQFAPFAALTGYEDAIDVVAETHTVEEEIISLPLL